MKEPYDDEEEDNRGWLARYGVTLGIGLCVAGGLGFGIYKISKGGGGSAPKTEHFVAISLPPPPPPPPPKIPPPEPPKEQKMETQVPDDAQKPEPPAPAQKAPEEPAGSNIKGDGNDAFGLSGNGGTGLGGGGLGGNGAGRSKYGWYAGQVKSRVAQAIQSNRRTRSASMQIEVRVWPDATGRITRASLDGSSGDPAVDAALRDEVLTGLRLQEPPPAGMPLPIVMRLTARRP